MPFIDKLFKIMVEREASDLHMTSGKKPILRVHGEIGPLEECTEIEAEQMRQILFEICPDENREEFESCCDTDFSYALEGLGRFRCNLFMDRFGPGGCFRLIPDEILTAEQLGLPRAVIDMCNLSKGLVLVTGPTGSGKSTTLAAMVDYINRNRREHIITIEDPVEFVHPDRSCLIHQREVGHHTESFKRALRAALREDPDVILVGELRDLETIAIAMETAETGHLVFGTLHTTTAASTVDRIIDQFPSGQQAQIRTMLAGSLKGIVAQVLCKKQPKGRVAALEVLVANSAVSAQIREGKVHQIINSMQTGGKIGMRQLNDSLIELVTTGLVLPDEAYLKAVHKDDLVNKLNSAGIPFDPAQLNAPQPAPGQAPAVAGAPVPGQPQAAAPVAPLPGGVPQKYAQPQAGPTGQGAPPAPFPVQEAPTFAEPAAPVQQPGQQPPAPGGDPDPFEQFRQRRRN